MARTVRLDESEIASSDNRCTHDEITRLADAMANGRLDERGDPSKFSGADGNLIATVNSMLDTLIDPLRLASDAIEKIAHGTIPMFIVDDYKGEYNRIKMNLNTLLATLYGMHHETQNLIAEIKEGRLDTRGNDWDFEGNWKELIGGVNGTLDAVIGPVRDASSVLNELAQYQLGARMRGKYHGDHAIIKKALNTTGDSLAGAIAQVAESVTSVTNAVQLIQKRIEDVAAGASEQARSIEETSKNIEQISASFQQSVTNTEEARKNVQWSKESMIVAKEAMVRMREAMSEIRSSADSTAAIVQEINEITRQTDVLASSASGKAAKVRSSAGGFGVVASEIRRMSGLCDVAVVALKGILRDGTDRQSGERNGKLEEIINDLVDIAMLSNLLGVNAAIEAAHVEGAGHDFEVLTDDIRQLAQRSADSARKTETLINHSVELARNGDTLTKELDGHVEGTVQATNDVGRLTDEIASATTDEARRIAEISNAIQDINSVTTRNVTLTHESHEAIRDLELQTKKLDTLVKTFHT